MTLASTDGRTVVTALAGAVQDATGQSVELADMDQGATDERAANAAEAEGIRLHVVKLPEASRGCVLPP